MPIPPTIDLPPPTSWDEFEKLIAELCIREWRTSNVSRYGRQGQPQQGVDIFGYPDDDKAKLTCVQCKCVETLTWKQVESAVDAAKAFRPRPKTFWIATTACNDAQLQKSVREAESDWPFLVYVRSWADLQLACTRFPDLVEQFWPTLVAQRMSVVRLRDIILDSSPASFKKVFGRDDEIRYVYERDVQLAVVVPAERGEPFDEEWIEVFPANALPPKPARHADVWITYAGQVLESFAFLYLDDARYLLPLPPAPAHEDRIIDPMQAALGRIVGQGTMHGFDDGISRAKMRLVQEHWCSKREWLREVDPNLDRD